MGLYRHPSVHMQPVAFCTDREAVRYFADQQHGIIVGGYSLVAPDHYREV